jgi:hypothetical protein
MSGQTPLPQVPGTGSAGKLAELLKKSGIVIPTPVASTQTKKTPKNGVYTATQTSSVIPDDKALADNVNAVFQQYYGRDASQTELQDWLPQLKSQYISKAGKPQTTVKYTYKNGQLIDTQTLTAQGEDPKAWLSNSVQTKLASGDVAVNKLNVPEGPAGKYFTAVKGLAAQNGIMLSDAAANDYAVKIAAGKLDANTAYATIRESAANAFPSLGEKIKQGIDLKTLADPYIQSMSNILEIPDTGIDLFDPKIRSALSFTLPDGKVGTKSIYDFEKELRQDPRWQYTNNARQQASSVATTVLKDFGFMG